MDASAAGSADEWQEAEPLGPFNAGDVGGDIQVSDAYSRRWFRPAPGGLWALVEVTTYVAKDDEAHWMEYDHAWALTRERESPWDHIVESDRAGEYAPDAELTDAGARAVCAAHVFDSNGWDGVIDGINDPYTLAQKEATEPGPTP